MSLETFILPCRSGVLTVLESEGVEFVDTYCVDNALVRVADPHFVGLASMRASDVCEALSILAELFRRFSPHIHIPHQPGRRRISNSSFICSGKGTMHVLLNAMCADSMPLYSEGPIPL